MSFMLSSELEMVLFFALVFVLCLVYGVDWLIVAILTVKENLYLWTSELS